MAETGLPEFDTTVQHTNAWLNDIQDAMGHPDKRLAYHALRGVLHALRDRLDPGELFDFSAQVPMLVRGILFDGYRPAGKPEKLDKEAFLERVAKELRPAGGENPAKAVEAVFQVIANHISPGEVDQVRKVLPKDLRAFWPGGSVTA